MANASKTHFGSGAHGKSAGVGAMTDMPKDKLGENATLSNRDKSRHSGERGYDSKGVQIDQMNDAASNKSDGRI